MDGIKRPRLEKKLPRRISRQDAERLLDFAFHGRSRYRFLCYRDRALVAVMLYTGLRLSETAHLMVSDVDLANGVLHVRCGKGAKDRVIPFLGTLRQYLLQHLKERERLGKTTPFFFCPVRQDRGLSTNGLKRVFTSLRTKSGVDFSAHRLRHTFATMMIEGGCDLFALQKMMGHASIQTTTIYLSASAQMLQAQVAKHPLG